MLNSRQVTDNILAAIETIAEKTIENVSYDKTVLGTIFRCKDASIGYYLVQYQDSIIEAYAADASVSYSRGTSVYVQIPQGNMKNRKTILGTTSQLGTDYISQIIQNEKVFDTSNNLIDTDLNIIGLSENWEGSLLLYDVNSENNKLKLDENIQGYLKNSSYLKMQADVQTNIPLEKRRKGQYGIKVTIKSINEATGELGYLEYYFSSDHFIGDPYNYSSYINQKIQSKMDGTLFEQIQSIEAYVKGFPGASADIDAAAQPHIFIKNFSLTGGVELTDSEKNGVGIIFKAPYGYIYNENSSSEDKRSFEAQVRVNLQTVDQEKQDVKIYWFQQDLSVGYDDDYYLQEGGLGWKCMNSGSKGNFLPSKILNIKKSQNPQRENKYKCVAVYAAQKYEKEFIVYNYGIEFSVSIESSEGTQFSYSVGHPNLTCNIVKKNGEINKNEEFRYTWYVNDNQNKTTFLKEEEIDENRYADWISDLKKKVDKESKVYWSTKYQKDEKYLGKYPNSYPNYNDKDTNQIVKNKLEAANKVYKAKQRLHGNILYNVDLHKVIDKSTFVCMVQQTQDAEKNKLKTPIKIGTASITLYNRKSAQNGYSLIINNGNQTFLYDENGLSLEGDSLESPYKISDLSYTLLYDGKAIEEKDLKFAQAEWRLPVGNSMLEFTKNDKKLDGTGYISERSGGTNFPVNFNISKKYSADKTNNEIVLVLNYKQLSLVAKTNFTFTKQGGNGTNGTTCQIKIEEVENESNLYEPYFNLAVGQQNNLSKAFKVSAWENGNKIDDSNLLNNSLKNIRWSFVNNDNHGSLFSISGPLTSRNAQIKYNKVLSSDEVGNVIGNILKVETTINGLKYYATKSIITVYNYFPNKYNIKVKKGSGFREVLYSSDGINPSYNERTPFEINVYKNINNTEEDVTNKTGQGLSYTWSVVSNYLMLTESANNTCRVTPVNTYNGKNCSSAAVKVEVRKKEKKEDKEIEITIGIVHIPIQFIVNRYSNAALNDWDGMAVKTQEGYILSPQVGAGKKDTDNSFTGIVIGVEQTNNKDKVGLLGYSKGEQSIFLDAETGNATFGTSGAAQIQIATTGDSTIQSGDYPYKKTTDTPLKKDKTYYEWDNKNKKYVEVKNPNSDDLKNGIYYEKGGGMKIKFSSTNTDGSGQGPYIKFGSGYFSVDSDGSIHAKGNGDIAGWIIDNNKIYKGTTGMSSQNITVKDIDPSKSKPQQNSTVAFYAGQTKQTGDTANSPNFYVTHDGYLFSKSGQIAGWNITKDKLSKGEVEINSNPGDEEKKDNVAFKCGNKFYVRHNGFLHSVSGNIGGWTIEPNRLSNGNVGMGTKKGKIGKTDITKVFWSGDKNGDKFYVTSNGFLYSDDGQLGNWVFGSHGLIGSSETLTKEQKDALSFKDTGKEKTVYVGSDGIYLGNNFSVTEDGTVRAESGKIGGCDISSSSISSTGWSIDSNGKASFSDVTIGGASVTGAMEVAEKGKISGGGASLGHGGFSSPGISTNSENSSLGKGCLVDASQVKVGNETLEKYIKGLSKAVVTDTLYAKDADIGWIWVGGLHIGDDKRDLGAFMSHVDSAISDIEGRLSKLENSSSTPTA